jgi:excisionase family DNA binding protein
LTIKRLVDYKKEKELGLTPKLDEKFNLPDDWVLTPEQIADLVGMSPITVRTWCREGKIEAYQFNRKYIITGKAFKKFMIKSHNRSKSVIEAIGR